MLDTENAVSTIELGPPDSGTAIDSTPETAADVLLNFFSPQSANKIQLRL